MRETFEIVGPSVASKMLRRMALVVTGAKVVLKWAPIPAPLWMVSQAPPDFSRSSNFFTRLDCLFQSSRKTVNPSNVPTTKVVAAPVAEARF